MLFYIKAEQESPWAGNPHVRQCLKELFQDVFNIDKIKYKNLLKLF